MRKRSAEGMHACAPALKSPQKGSRGGQTVLDCVLLALLLGGLTDALCGAYGLRADPLPLCLLAIGAAVAIRLCVLARRAGWLIGAGLCLIWIVYLFRRIDWICAGAVQLANDALSTLADQSGGTFSFSPWQLTNGLPRSAAVCEAAFLAAVLPVLGALFVLLIWQRRPLLTGLLAFIWLLPALYYTILPPMIAMAAMMTAVVVLAVLHPAGGSRALSNGRASLRRGWVALPVGLVCAAILLSALPPDSYTRSPKLEQARQVVESLLDSAAPGRIRNGLANNTTRVDMQRTEGISFSGKTVLRVQGPSGQPLYLKGFVGGTYADSAWTTPDASVYQRFSETETGQSGVVSNPQLLPARFETLVEKQYQDGNTQHDGYSLSVENVAANPRCAYIPYGLTALPENAAFDGDTRAIFRSFFGETSYTVPFRMYGDFLNVQYRMIGGSRLSGQQPTTQWPVQLPSTSLSMLQANLLDYTSIQPLTNAILRDYLWEGTNSIDRSAAQEKMNQLYLYGWQRTDITEEQRKTLCWLSALTAQSLQEQKGNTLAGTEAAAYYRGLYTDTLAPVKAENGQPTPDSTPLDLTEYDQETGAYWNYEFAYRKAIYDTYTAVPDALREKLMQWLREHGLEGSAFSSLVTNRTQFVVGVADAIQDSLAAECQYTLNPGAPPAGTDFIDYFLNTNHKGYCVHFATAETLLLRTLGIPARYAEGYYLTSDMISDDGAWADVPDSRAHAWVEIYSPGIGWVPFEATPGFSANEAPDNMEDQDTSSDESSSVPASEVSSTASDSSQNSEETTSSASSMPADTEAGSRLGDAAAIAVGIAVIAALGILGLVLRHLWAVRRRWRKFHQADRNAAGVAVYAYLLQLQTYGIHVPEEAAHLGEKARFSQHTLTAEECAVLRQYAAKASAELFARQPNGWMRFVLRYFANLFYQDS